MEWIDDLPGSRRGDLHYLFALLCQGRGHALVGRDTIDDLQRMARQERMQGLAQELEALRAGIVGERPAATASGRRPSARRLPDQALNETGARRPRIDPRALRI